MRTTCLCVEASCTFSSLMLQETGEHIHSVHESAKRKPLDSLSHSDHLQPSAARRCSIISDEQSMLVLMLGGQCAPAREWVAPTCKRTHLLHISRPAASTLPDARPTLELPLHGLWAARSDATISQFSHKGLCLMRHELARDCGSSRPPALARGMP